MDGSLQIAESAAVAGPIRADGTVAIHIIRPGVGRGRGRHLYEADMLQRHAGVFKGWKMFMDHQSDEAKKRAGGLPRSIRELGGRVLESYWDPSVPANPEKGWGQGAVVGIVRPTRFVRSLIEDDPELVETSIAAQATSVRPVMAGGRQAMLVEGIRSDPQGSVDWVTVAGAGGRVAQLMEAAYGHIDADAVSSLGDDELLAYIQEERPGLLEALHGDGEGGTEVGDISPEVLQEAMQSDAFKTSLAEAVAAALAPEKVAELVEAKVAEKLEIATTEARAEADRAIKLRDLREAAHKRIDAARLPAGFAADVRSKFEIRESGEPTDALDVIDEVDGEGKLVKSASDKVMEAVDAEITRARTLLAEANPTKVSGQGASKPSEGGGEGGEKPKSTGSPLTDSLLTEAGFSEEDLAEMYARR